MLVMANTRQCVSVTENRHGRGVKIRKTIKGGGALMNLIMNLADLGKSENNEFVENEKI